MNRQGIFFTGLVLIVITVSLLSYAIIHKTTSRSEITQRVETLDAFVYASEQDLKRQLYISGFRVVFTAQDYITRQGSYLANTEQQFTEAFFNGTLFNQPEALMIGTTYTDMNTILQTRAAKMNLNASLANATLAVTQVDPWHLLFVLHANLQIRDKNGLAQVVKTVAINASVPLESFEDPLYIIGSKGAITNKLRKTPYTSFVIEGNVANLLNHTLSGYYHASALAPRFFDRLQGNNSASPQGVESLVDLPELSAQGGNALSKTVVDYLYFSESNPTSVGVAGMPSWFKLDTNHLATYTS